MSVALLQGALLCSLPSSASYCISLKLSFWLMGLVWLAVQHGRLGLAGTRSTCRGIARGSLKWGAWEGQSWGLYLRKQGQETLRSSINHRWLGQTRAPIAWLFGEDESPWPAWFAPGLERLYLFCLYFSLFCSWIQSGKPRPELPMRCPCDRAALS